MGHTSSGTRTAPALQEAVGDLLKRDERTLAWLARKVDVSTGHLHRVVAGERPLTSELAGRMAAVFEVSPSTFLPEPNE